MFETQNETNDDECAHLVPLASTLQIDSKRQCHQQGSETVRKSNENRTKRLSFVKSSRKTLIVSCCGLILGVAILAITVKHLQLTERDDEISEECTRLSMCTGWKEDLHTHHNVACAEILQKVMQMEKLKQNFQVKYETTKGIFSVNVDWKWANTTLIRRYLILSLLGYNELSHFYRVDRTDMYSESREEQKREPWVAQFGYCGDTATDSCWADNLTMRCFNAPTEFSPGNVKGTVAFGLDSGGGCSTELYINYSNNSRLDKLGFAPIGFIKDSEMTVINNLYDGYGEVQELCGNDSCGNNNNCDELCHQAFCNGCGTENVGVNMSRFILEGNSYLDRDKPLLDFIKKRELVQQSD